MHGFSPVNAGLFITCDTAFYAITLVISHFFSTKFFFSNWYSLESHQWDTYNEYPQHMSLWRNKKQEAYGQQFAHLSKTTIAYLQMPCNILSELPANGTEIWPCCKKVKCHPRIIIWTNLVDITSLMLSLKAFLVLEKILSVFFYHMWAWRTSCSIVLNHLNKLTIPFDRRPQMKYGENWSSTFREDI